MANISLRLKNEKKGITPVIATIILIAGTLVLALVVGAYTFGIFGSNVKTVQLSSGILNSGAATIATAAGANFQLTLNNPGSATWISSVTMTTGGTTIPLTFWTCSAPGTCVAVVTPFVAASWPVGPGSVPVTIYFGNVLTSGTTYNYVLNFNNGQALTGSLIAQ